MTPKFPRSKIRAIVITFAAILVTVAACASATEQVILNFPKTGSGAAVNLVYHAGRFYGASPSGGDTKCSNGCGSVFELVPKAGGGWNYHLLYAFTGQNDGEQPVGTVVFDASGNLYGAVHGATVMGNGGVFKLTPTSSGQWTETTIYSFNEGSGHGDGWQPNSGLTEDASGNLYGVTLYGGTNQGAGTVYRLTMNSGGTWSETLLYSFYPSPDGQFPSGEVIFDQAGNLYGTTIYGGSGNLGTVYELSPGSGGVWTEKLIYSFDGTYGETPEGPVSLDPAGNVFGLTYAGGTHGEGTAFELIPGTGGTWTPALLHSFGAPGDGSFPVNGYLTAAASATFYGTTFTGGANNGGIVFRLKQQSSGQWSENVVYSFALTNNGYSPVSGVTVGPGNGLFGGTGYGGTTSNGVIYEVTP